MLTKARNRKTLITIFILFLIICVPIVLMLSMTKEPFDGSGFFIFLVTVLISGYISGLTYLLIGEELDSGRIKLWLALPSSRKDFTLRVCKRLLANATAVSFILYVITIITNSILYDSTPRDPFASVIGILQLTLVLTAFSAFVFVFLRGKYTVLVGVVIPVIRLFIYIKDSIINRMLAGGDNTLDIMELIMPLGTGFRNLVYGYSPILAEQRELIFSDMGSLFKNVYPIFWMIVVGVLITYKIKHTDY